MPNVNIYANFSSKKLRGLGYTGDQILDSAIEMAGHPYNSAPVISNCLRTGKSS